MAAHPDDHPSDWDDELENEADADAEDDELEEVPCPECGQLIAEDSPGCPHCGTWVVARGPAASRSRGLLYLLLLAAVIGGLVGLTSC